MSGLVELSVEDIAALTKAAEPSYIPTYMIHRLGPIRHHDQEKLCMGIGRWEVDDEGQPYFNRNRSSCKSPTNHTFDGIPYCYAHLIDKANRELWEVGYGKQEG